NYGTGHGWTMAWGIIWNSQAATLCAQNPYNYYLNDPSASQRSYYHNWLVGGNGTNIPGDFMTTLTGTYDSVGVTVEPQSLYLAQMAQKTGSVSF
ncbi:hemagglutinin-related protein, partial [Planoprotostelium fungivorum]